MEREEKKLMQKSSPAQMAKVMGNQAVVQMMPSEIAWTFIDVCTPHFIQGHLIDGTSRTLLSQGRMGRLKRDFLAAGRPMQMVYNDYSFDTVEHEGVNKIHHLASGRSPGY